MEPFFLRCETCRARLRVRDERFLGEVQSCPKCGSMVQIIAPAGWLASGEAAPEPVEVAAAAAPTLGVRIIGMLREHALLWTAGAATVLIAGALATTFGLRGNREVATLPQKAPIVAASAEDAEEPTEELSEAAPATQEVVAEEQSVVETPGPTAGPASETPPQKVPPKPDKVVEAVAPEAPSSPMVSEPVAKVELERPRTLTLEPVKEDASARATIGIAAAEPNYPPALEAKPASTEAKPQAAVRPTRVTNVKDQLAVPIESIDMPAMPIGEFVNMASTMAAVPIKLDPKVLGEVGLSTRSTVKVHGDNTTVGQLLAGVLKEHHLTCVQHDGVLLVVKARQ